LHNSIALTKKQGVDSGTMVVVKSVAGWESAMHFMQKKQFWD
jgi:hypothetical protein